MSHKQIKAAPGSPLHLLDKIGGDLTVCGLDTSRAAAAYPYCARTNLTADHVALYRENGNGVCPVCFPGSKTITELQTKLRAVLAKPELGADPELDALLDELYDDRSTIRP